MSKKYIDGFKDGFLFQKEKIDLKNYLNDIEYANGFKHGITYACFNPNYSLGVALEKNFKSL